MGCFGSLLRVIKGLFRRGGAAGGGGEKTGAEQEGSCGSNVPTEYEKQTGGRLEKERKGARGHIGQEEVRVLYRNVSFHESDDTGLNTIENLKEAKEKGMAAVEIGPYASRCRGVEHILVESLVHLVAAADQGAYLSILRGKDKETVSTPDLYNDPDKDYWLRKINYNFAQYLLRCPSDRPSCWMTPYLFVQAAVQALCPCGIGVEIRDGDWLDMGEFFVAARGRWELPLAYLELAYCGGGQKDKPTVIVGKGVTFDYCELRKGVLAIPNMTEAAEIMAALRAISKLNLPINISGVIPIFENKRSGEIPMASTADNSGY